MRTTMEMVRERNFSNLATLSTFNVFEAVHPYFIVFWTNSSNLWPHNSFSRSIFQRFLEFSEPIVSTVILSKLVQFVTQKRQKTAISFQNSLWWHKNFLHATQNFWMRVCCVRDISLLTIHIANLAVPSQSTRKNLPFDTKKRIFWIKTHEFSI